MNNQNKKDFISINEYLDNVNLELIKNVSRVIGEVTEVQMYPGRSYLFFKIKDKDEENPALLTCIMWKRDYDIIPVYRKMNFSILSIRNNIFDSIIKEISEGFVGAKNKIEESLTSYQKQLNSNDPKRQLRLGYSIVMKNGRILKTASQIQKGDIVNIGLSEGSFDSEVKIINNKII